MNDVKSNVEKILEELKQDRDELQVKVHLAKMEASEEWEKLETKMGKLEDKSRELASATADAAQDIGAAAKLLGEEIRDGFKKISKHF